jgi:hypothetical protein
VYVKEKKIRKNKLACVPRWILPFKNKRHCRDGWTVVGKRRTMDKGDLGIKKNQFGRNASLLILRIDIDIDIDIN